MQLHRIKGKRKKERERDELEQSLGPRDVAVKEEIFCILEIPLTGR